MRVLYLTALFIIVTCIPIQSQTGYKKKVVSFVDHVVVGTSNGLSDRHTTYISNSVSKSVQLERFHYAALPQSIVDKFSVEASGAAVYTAESIRPIVQNTLAPELTAVLDINKELLSKQNLSEADRNTFLATKAQSAGLSATQLEAILNSGFFYVPYVEYYKRSTGRGERDIKNEKGKVVRKQKYTTFEHEMKIGLLWYKLNVDRSNNATVSFVGTARGWGGDAISRSGDQDDGAEGNADWEAFVSAVNASAVNIGNETKKLEEFKLSGGVNEVTTFGVNLNLGTREGVGLDDSYWVEELVETESGEIIKERRGFVKIREVGNNKSDESAFSYAQTITGTGYSPGLSVTEIPMLGLNGIVGFGKIPVSISKFDDTFILPDGRQFWLRIDEDYSGMFGPTASLQANLANATKISELWLNIGAGIGFPNPVGKFVFIDYSKTPNTFDSSKNAGPAIGGFINFGLVKKYYFRRFGLILQGDGRFNLTYLTDAGKDNNGDELNYKMLHSSIGFDAKAGLEVYVTPAFSIGAGAEYSGSPVSDEWSVTVTDKDNNDTKLDNAKGPQVKYSGLGWFVWFNFAIPSLN